MTSTVRRDPGYGRDTVMAQRGMTALGENEDPRGYRRISSKLEREKGSEPDRGGKPNRAATHANRPTALPQRLRPSRRPRAERSQRRNAEAARPVGLPGFLPSAAPGLAGRAGPA